MTENEGYQQVMACVMSTMPDAVDQVRFKAYLSPEANYMSAAASYRMHGTALVEATVEEVFPDLFGLLVALRRVQQGDAVQPWLTVDITFIPSTGKLSARYGYERPDGGAVTIDAQGQ